MVSVVLCSVGATDGSDSMMSCSNLHDGLMSATVPAKNLSSIASIAACLLIRSVVGAFSATPSAALADSASSLVILYHRPCNRLSFSQGIYLFLWLPLPFFLPPYCACRTTLVLLPYNVSSFFGGTSLLIIVGVTIDTLSQMESHLVMKNYDGFLTRGRLRGRRG